MDLVKRRIQLLSRHIGRDFDLEKMNKERESARITKYEEFLQREYNISREKAAELMDSAMLDLKQKNEEKIFKRFGR